MAKGETKEAVTLRITPQERDILDALVYLQSKTSRSAKSPNDVLGPLVSQFLKDHANDPGVQLSIQAAAEAARAKGGAADVSSTPS